MHVDPGDLDRDIEDYRRGRDEAGDRLCDLLRGPVRRDAARLLGDDDVDVDDVTQESLLAALGYLRRDEAFSGDLVRLAVTIARNRCRDILRARNRRPHVDIEPLAAWIANPGRSALDELQERERRGLLQAALDLLPASCRQLLHALYVEGRSPQEVQARAGLGTVQGVYHRRSVCLEQARKLVQRRLRFGSWTGSGTVAADRRHRKGPSA